MFRLYDILVILSSLVTLALSIFLWINQQRQEALFIAILLPSLLGFGIYFKLLRIVHFVLYKNLNKKE